MWAYLVWNAVKLVNSTKSMEIPSALQRVFGSFLKLIPVRHWQLARWLTAVYLNSQIFVQGAELHLLGNSLNIVIMIV